MREGFVYGFISEKKKTTTPESVKLYKLKQVSKTQITQLDRKLNFKKHIQSQMFSGLSVRV